jgi:hypothetical protein
MELTRRDFLVLAVSAAPLAVSLPSSVLAAVEHPAAPPSPPSDPFLLDELPIQGFAGECSGRAAMRRSTTV